MSEIESPESFDADYVKQLRNEAANYRQKAKGLQSELEGYHGLEAQIREARIENVLARRGINAEASWISVTADQTPAEAVDAFLEKYPMFLGGESSVEVDPKQIPKAMSPNPGNVNAEHWQKASLQDIKKDPVARQSLTETYRDMLKSSSNQHD